MLKMADQRWSDIYIVSTKIFCGGNFCVWYVTKLKFTGQLQMASLSLYRQSETNLMSNRKVIELVLQLKSAKAHRKNYIKVTPLLIRHLLRNRLLPLYCCTAVRLSSLVSARELYSTSVVILS